MAILHFSNKTGSAHYDWLSESLSGAVNKSLEKAFIYDRPNVPRNQKSADKIFKTKKFSDAKLSRYVKIFSGNKDTIRALI